MQRKCMNICRSCLSNQFRRFCVDAFENETKNVKRRKGANFLDKLRIHTSGGPGGHGFAKFGGIGGRGGHVIVKASKDAKFKDILQANPRKRFFASPGGDSSRRVLLGMNGEDTILHVPLGVTVSNDEGLVLGDLNEDGQEIIVAYGGIPGSQNNDYIGKKGESHNITLDLKLIADIGLVGFPNAGKSTFLSAISQAKPKIAEYPFTTIRPQIGTMMFPDFRQITVADLPGLIEGAHINFGMGHKFLKHVERTKVLLFMVDINGFQLSQDYTLRNAFETILLLNKELELFNPELLKKPAVLALNKIDTDKNGQITDDIVNLIKQLPDSLSIVDESLHPETLVKFEEIHKISTMFDLNIKTIKSSLRELLDICKNIEDSTMTGDTVRENKRISKQLKLHGREHNKYNIT
ncbi:GTP-binding protein 10 [Mactra antiquata]